MGALVPIAELLNQSDDGSPPIEWHLTPSPTIGSENVGVDVASTRRLLWIAGLGGMVVRDGQGGDPEHLRVEGGRIHGINPDGSAVGAMQVSGAMVRTSRASLGDWDPRVHPKFQWPVAQVAVDRAAVARCVADDVARRERDARMSSWVQHTDSALRRGILGAASKALMVEPLKHPVVYLECAVPPFIVGEYATLWGIQGGIYAALTTSVMGALAGLYTGRRTGRELKMGLFPTGFYPDRFSVAALYAATHRLVRPLPAAKE